MVRLQTWQWVVLALPLVSVLGFLGIAASMQIHQWGLNWVWAVFLVLFVGWRWLLNRWLHSPALAEVETALAELEAEAAALTPSMTGSDRHQQAQRELQRILQAAREDLPPWEDWQTFWQRCQTLVAAVARVYHPDVKRPLLNVYIPQAYGLIRGTVEDVDRWMHKLSPALNQMTVGQAVEAYELYQKLEPATRTALKIWNWSMWVLNPAAALARTATRRYTNTANQQLLANLGQILREQALTALGTRAIALYSGEAVPVLEPAPALPQRQTQRLRDLLVQAEDPELDQKPVRLLLMGRTGAGKSSLINTLFMAERATVDLLPTTVQFQEYRWQAATGEALVLIDAPGYEQIGANYRNQLLDQAAIADALILVTPAPDPALEMDRELLRAAQAEVSEQPVIAVVTQVDRLRPLREWQPPYDWQRGERPKERSIREAVAYRQEMLGDLCSVILPVVNRSEQQRPAWGLEPLAQALLEHIEPAKQLRLARFLRDLEARTAAATQVIDRYAFQMSTTQGLAALLKSPILQFLSTMMTGSPTLAVLLAEKIPVEQSPLVLGRLQMAYELFTLLKPSASLQNFDLLTLWPLLLEQSMGSSIQDAWAFGQTLIELWTHGLEPQSLKERYRFYQQQG